MSKLRQADSLDWLAIHSSLLGKFQAKFQSSQTSCLKNEEGGERKDEEEKDENKKGRRKKSEKGLKMAFIFDLWSSYEWVYIYTHTHTYTDTHMNTYIP